MDLYILEFHINGIMLCGLFVWFLPFSIKFSSFIHIGEYLFMAQQYSIVWIYHICLPIIQLMDFWVRSIFLGIRYYAAMNIHVQVFMWKYVFCSLAYILKFISKHPLAPLGRNLLNIEILKLRLFIILRRGESEREQWPLGQAG